MHLQNANFSARCADKSNVFCTLQKSGMIVHIHAIGSIDFHSRGDDSSGHLCEMQLFYKFEFTVDKPRIPLQK